ncbi:MAG: zinc-binding dehydrogenase [Sphingomonadaceae bacterium]
MKGLVKYASGPGSMRVMEMSEPALRPGHVIIEVEAAGVCGTDLHIQSAEYPCDPPVILGHEFSGVVAEVAPDVTRVQVGQRVTSLPYFSTCGACEFCLSGEWNLCPGRKSAGSGTHGAFASYVLMPERSVRPLPEGVDFVAGAVSEPLACCCHALMEKARIRPTDLVVVLGPGSIGLLSVQVAVACGATVVLVGTGADAARLELARELGVHHTAQVETRAVGDLVRDLTGGRGADVVVECSGAGPAVGLGYELVKRKGQYVQLGLFGRKIELDPDPAVMKEVDVRNSFASTPTAWDYALRLLGDGRVRTRPLVTDELPLERWEEGFARFRNKQGIKVVLLPKG